MSKSYIVKNLIASVELQWQQMSFLYVFGRGFQVLAPNVKYLEI